MVILRENDKARNLFLFLQPALQAIADMQRQIGGLTHIHLQSIFLLDDVRNSDRTLKRQRAGFPDALRQHVFCRISAAQTHQQIFKMTHKFVTEGLILHQIVQVKFILQVFQNPHK